MTALFYAVIWAWSFKYNIILEMELSVWFVLHIQLSKCVL